MRQDGVTLNNFLWFYFSVFFLILDSTEKVYQTLKTIFNHISKQLEIRQKYFATRSVFNSVRGQTHPKQEIAMFELTFAEGLYIDQLKKKENQM